MNVMTVKKVDVVTVKEGSAWKIRASHNTNKNVVR